MQQAVQDNIPLIQHASTHVGQAKLRNEDPTKYQSGSKALVPINPGQHVLNDKNSDSNPNKRPKWSKGIVTELDNPRKYKIATDAGRDIMRNHRHLRPDRSYVTNSGCVSKPPDRFIVKM